MKVPLRRSDGELDHDHVVERFALGCGEVGADRECEGVRALRERGGSLKVLRATVGVRDGRSDFLSAT